MLNQNTSTLSTSAVHNLPAADVKDYIELLKPRVMSLVVFTGFVGLFASHGHFHPVLAIIIICCIAMGSGAASAINMWYDRDIDILMKRTAKRPLPAGRVAPSECLAFGIILSLFSIMILGLASNWLAAGLLAAAIFYYVVIYTIWLKRRTVQNIVIGGGAGAFPPLISWAAVTNEVDLAAFSLFFLIFMWTPSHFWALSLECSDEYKKAGVPMLPVISGKKVTKINILIYSLLLYPTIYIPYYYGLGHQIYLISALLLTSIAVYYACKIFQQKNEKKFAWRFFYFSIWYLFILFSIILFENMNF